MDDREITVAEDQLQNQNVLIKIGDRVRIAHELYTHPMEELKEVGIMGTVTMIRTKDDTSVSSITWSANIDWYNTRVWIEQIEDEQSHRRKTFFATLQDLVNYTLLGDEEANILFHATADKKLPWVVFAKGDCINESLYSFYNDNLNEWMHSEENEIDFDFETKYGCDFGKADSEIFGLQTALKSLANDSYLKIFAEILRMNRIIRKKAHLIAVSVDPNMSGRTKDDNWSYLPGCNYFSESSSNSDEANDDTESRDNSTDNNNAVSKYPNKSGKSIEEK